MKQLKMNNNNSRLIIIILLLIEAQNGRTGLVVTFFLFTLVTIHVLSSILAYF